MLAAILAVAALAVPATTVQGDSLSVGAEPYMTRVVSFSAAVGRHVQQGLELLRRQRLAPVVVFALGSNDAAEPPALFAAQVRAALAIVGSRRCLVVPSLYVYGPVRALNRVLRALAARVGPARLQVPDWASVAARIPLAGGVHPLDYRLRARVVEAGVRACQRA